MPTICKFNLNKENATYFSGDIIAGTITLTTTSDKTVKGIQITFIGKGKVKWKDSQTGTYSNGTRSPTTTYFQSNELYVNNNTLVHGQEVLPAGRHNYTFNIPLPLECPSSCEGKYGHVRYELSLKINRYCHFDNIFKMPVTILKTVDLNLNPVYKLPLVLETISSSCFWPCAKGKVLYTLQIPFGAYASGQSIRYTLYITNQSMDDTEGYYIEFYKIIIFTARTPRHKERSCEKLLIAQSYNTKCLRLTKRIIEDEVIVPNTPPTNERSSIICVEYKLKVTLKLSGCSSNPALEVPIAVGTIPIRESLPAAQYLMSGSQGPTNAISADHCAGGDLPPSYNEIVTFEGASSSELPFLDTDTDEKIM